MNSVGCNNVLQSLFKKKKDLYYLLEFMMVWFHFIILVSDFAYPRQLLCGREAIISCDWHSCQGSNYGLAWCGMHFLLITGMVSIWWMGNILKYKPGTACSERNSPKSNVVRILSFSNFNNLKGGMLFIFWHFYLPQTCKI